MEDKNDRMNEGNEHILSSNKSPSKSEAKGVLGVPRLDVNLGFKPPLKSIQIYISESFFNVSFLASTMLSIPETIFQL